MFISIYFVVDSTHRVANAVSLRRVLHDDLAQGLLCTNGMFATGFLSGYPWGEDRRHINAFCFLVSCYCFYGALGHIDQMLKSNQTVARDCGATGLAFQFSIVRKTFFCVWHLFPMVWALAACGSLSIQVEHIGYIVADVVAKFLLMFVYVALRQQLQRRVHSHRRGKARLYASSHAVGLGHSSERRIGMP